jgi:hypothetical protein
MSRITLVRYAAKSDRAAENETLSRAVFAELRAKRPHGFAYGVLRDGDNFVHVFVNLREDDSSVLVDLPSFKAFSQSGPERHATAPEIVRLDAALLDSYGFADETAPA